MPHGVTVSSTHQNHQNHKKQKIKWSMTVMMNARDLSRDDDFLSHLLVEHLGTADSPLQVHKMDPTRHLPAHDPAHIIDIVKKYIVRKGGSSTTYRIKRAVDALLQVNAVRVYLYRRSPAQINAFATHASRYFELYLPTGSIEISHTSRYSHRTGKSELCILATTNLKVGQVITDLKGSLAHLTPEEDEELKRTDVGRGRRGALGIRRDFSVIHSNQKNKSHLFLGPARFVNHDCDHNVELFRDGRIITFRVIKPITAGQEVTAHYGEGYFGKGNRHCLCQTCEKQNRGGYAQPAPAIEGKDSDLEDDSSTDEETRNERIRMGLGLATKGNPNERRTRRGVYAIVAERDSDEEDDSVRKKNGVVSGPLGTSNTVGSVSAAAGNASLIRRLSDASSSLTSLSDNERNTNAPTMPLVATAMAAQTTPINSATIVAITLPTNAQNYAETSAPTTRLSSVSRLSSLGPMPPTSASEASQTPTPSRMSTRSSAAPTPNTRLGHAATSLTPIGKEISMLGSERRTTRSASNPLNHVADPSKKDKSASIEKERGKGAQARDNINSASPTPTKISEGKRPLQSLFQFKSKSKSKSKSSTPAVTSAPAAVEKPQPLVPTCGTCGNELPNLVAAGVQVEPGVVHSCARCKRHFAIFGSPWPDRLSNLEPLSSSSESGSDEQTSPRKDKSGKVRIIDSPNKQPNAPFPVRDMVAVRRRRMQSLHHAEYQPRHSNGQFGRADEEAMGHPKSASVMLGKRKWDGSQADNDDESQDILIRRLGFRPIFPSLCARPSPILFAKSAWKRPDDSDGFKELQLQPQQDAESLPDNNTEEDGREKPGLKSLRSISRDMPYQSLSMFGSSPAPSNPSAIPHRKSSSLRSCSILGSSNSLKRKRESTASESTKTRQKAGRTFYLYDEKKKPLPKGWVIITDSSEENGEEEEEREQSTPQPPIPASFYNRNPASAYNITNPQVDDCSALTAGMGSVSVTASTPSLVHTPSSRADSAPAQGVRTPPDEQQQQQVITPLAGAVAGPPISSLHTSHEPDSQSLQTPKRRKPNIDTEDQRTHRTRSRAKQNASLAESSIGVKHGLTRSSSNNSNPAGTDIGNQEMTADAQTWTVTAALPSGGDKIAIVAVPRSQASSSSHSTSLLNTNKFVVELQEEDSAAMKVSNLIHGTASVYGHPDARTSWKPRYQFTEIDGWNLATAETVL